MTSSFEKYIGFDNLKIGDYRLYSFTLANTNFGEKVRCDIGENVIYISKRYIEQLEPGKDIRVKIDELNDGTYWLLYRGKDPAHGYKLLIEIVSADEYLEGFLNFKMN